jgi:probable F420-dependent oxidoreductase
MQLSLSLIGVHRSFGPDPRHIVELARVADDAGVDQVVVADHVVMGERTDRYPYGEFPFPPGDPWPEPLTTLAAVAGATRRIRLATGVLIAPLRPAVLLAKTAATLDALSGGRLDLGVGIGWQEEEFAALGVPMDRRWGRTMDALRACRALWQTDGAASFASDTVTFERVWCAPRPAQARLPIWFGAQPTPVIAERLAEIGDGWFPLGVPPAEDIRAGLATIHEACRTEGRDPAEIGVRAGLRVHRDLPRTFAPLGELTAAGVTMVSIALPGAVATRADAARFLTDLVLAFRDVTKR